MRWVGWVAAGAVFVSACTFGGLDGLTSSGTSTPDGGRAEAGASGLDDSGPTTVSDSGTPTGDSGNPPAFTDDFNRADGPVGNGWIEGVTGFYAIQSGSLVMPKNNYDFETNYLYRPTPSFRDLKVSVEVTPTALPPSYPQLHVRNVTLGNDNYADYEIGIPNDNTSFFWGRGRPAGGFDVIQEVDLSEKIAVGNRYRMSLSVAGDTPVHLTATLERQDGNGGWVVIGSGSSDDSADDRIEAAGSFGISCNDVPNYTYDNFSVTPL